MRNLSAIDENKDLVTKEYADGRVVANPTLAGTESDLTGLQVNGTKYKVPSGGGGGGGTPYDSNPAMDGTASPGSSTAYARGDHVHPISVVANPTLAGTEDALASIEIGGVKFKSPLQIEFVHYGS